MSYHIYSTLANNQRYATYKPSQPGQDIAIIDKEVLIEGKAGVANKNLITPRGVVTKITDSQYKILDQCKMFNRHVTRGYIAVEKKNEAIDKVLVGMEPRDVSAPITPEFYEKAPDNIAKPSKKRSA